MGAQCYPRTVILVSKLCFAINSSRESSVPVDLKFSCFIRLEKALNGSGEDEDQCELGQMIAIGPTDDCTYLVLSLNSVGIRFEKENGQSAVNCQETRLITPRYGTLTKVVRDNRPRLWASLR